MTSKGHKGRTCRGTTKSGDPCRMAPLKDSTFCWNHDPKTAKKREASRQKGGRASRRALPSELAGTIEIREAKDALALLTLAANETLRLDNSVSRNRALGDLAYKALRAIEITDLEARIVALEEASNGREDDDEADG